MSVLAAAFAISLVPSPVWVNRGLLFAHSPSLTCSPHHPPPNLPPPSAAVTVSMLKGMEPSSEHVRTVLLVLSHLASTQPDFTELPAPALKVSFWPGARGSWCACVWVPTQCAWWGHPG